MEFLAPWYRSLLDLLDWKLNDFPWSHDFNDFIRQVVWIILYGPYDMDQIWNLKKTGSIIEEFEISKLLGLSIYMSFMTMLL